MYIYSRHDLKHIICTYTTFDTIYCSVPNIVVELLVHRTSKQSSTICNPIFHIMYVTRSLAVTPTPTISKGNIYYSSLYYVPENWSNSVGVGNTIRFGCFWLKKYITQGYYRYTFTSSVKITQESDFLRHLFYLTRYGKTKSKVLLLLSML